MKRTALKRGTELRQRHGMKRTGGLERQTTHGATIGGNAPPEYRALHDAIGRCYSKTNAAYSRYGGRGIGVCDRWRFGDGKKTAYECFLSDMGTRPSKRYSLDRFPDNDGDYEPSNCRWATASQQQRNRVGCHWIRFGEDVITIQEACERVGLASVTVHTRIGRLGWSIQDALTKPSARSKQTAPLTNVVIEDIGVARRPV